MGNSAERRDGLLDVMQQRFENLPPYEQQNLVFGMGEIPIWYKVFKNIAYPGKINDQKRLHLPMLQSNPVIKFLSDIKERVADLVSKRHEEANGEDAMFDGGQSVSYQSETKEMFISYLESFIRERKLDTFATFGDVHDDKLYRFSDEFPNIKDLYKFLKVLSQKSDEEIANFILNTIPSSPWDTPYTKLREE